MSRQRLAPEAYLVTYDLAQELPGDNHCFQLFKEEWRAHAFVDDCNSNYTGRGAINAVLVPLFREAE